eukprot:870123-Amphidinium_carterae.1
MKHVDSFWAKVLRYDDQKSLCQFRSFFLTEIKFILTILDERTMYFTGYSNPARPKRDKTH